VISDYLFLSADGSLFCKAGYRHMLLLLYAAPHHRPDITKIKSTLGWEPKVPLREGLAHMVQDFKKRLNVK
jgi:nucleoside-diphosphate-sugar epimerase